MSNRKLFRAIGQIDEDLIEEAAEYKVSRKKQKIWVSVGAMVACAVIAVSAGSVLGKKTAQSVVTAAESAAETAATTADTTAAYDSQIASRTVVAGELEVVATDESDGYIAEDTGFVISGSGLTIQELSERIVISPDTDFVLEELNDDEFLITPTASLVSNSLVNIELDDENGTTVGKWAFQTEDVFRVTSTYPMDDYASSNTGIEIAFNTDDIDLESVKEAFSISPEVKGSFQFRGKTLVFQPEEGALEPGTEYIVRLKADAASASGQTLGEDTVFSFTVSSWSDERVIYGAQYEVDTFIPGDIPAAELSVNGNYQSEKVSVTYYSFDGFDSFASAIEANKNAGQEPDINGLTKTAQFEADQMIGQNGYSYVFYPEVLAQGQYLAVYSIGVDDKAYELYRFMQVTPISVYCASGEKQLLLWVNDTEKNASVEDAGVTISSEGNRVTAVTDASGCAIVDVPGESSCVVTITSGSDSFATIVGRGSDNDSYDSNYYGYIYTSRQMYLPTDTIRIWGYIQPRKSGVTMPDSVEVKIGELAQEQVKVSTDGSFCLEFSYEDVAADYVAITASVSDVAICKTNVSISGYTKPIYVLDASTDKEIYFTNEAENVQVEANVTFYDGTAAGGMLLKYRKDYDYENAGYITCDEEGNVNFSVSFDLNSSPSNNSWHPKTGYISINTDENDSVDTYCDLRPLIFYRDVMLQAKVDGDNVNVTANLIDLGDIETSDKLYTSDYPENIRGAAYDCDVTASITMTYYEKIPTGTRYDFVNKETVSTYNYEYRSESLGKMEGQLVNGKAVFTDLPKPREDAHYEVTISCYDTNGNLVQTSVYYSGKDYSGLFYGNQDAIDLSFAYAGTKFDEYGNGANTFVDGEAVDIAILNNYKSFEAMENGYFLSFVRQDEFYGTELHTGDGFTLGYSDDHIPNITLAGAYFADGKVYEIDPVYLSYDHSERELEVDIIPEQEQYRPGETAMVTVKVTNSRGEPVKGATVLVSVSDEAAFAVAPQTVTFADDFYDYRYWGTISTYTSYKQIDGNQPMMAEMGGEGSGEFRKEFVDDLSFETAVTDEYGTVTLLVPLADNLTSWRVTALAAKEMKVGNGKTNFSTALPMFISPNVSDTYLVGDTISFGCRTYGTEIDASDKVTYEYSVLDANGDVVDITEGWGTTQNAGDNAYFVLDVDLEPGQYILRLSGSTGEYSDGVELPFEVVETAAELWFTKESDGSDLNDLEVTKYPLSITLSNGAYKVYNQVLNTVTSRGSRRTDQLAAKVYGARLMTELTGDESYRENAPEAYELAQNTRWNFISELSGGSGSAYYTARMAAAVPELLNKSGVVTQFRDVLDNAGASTEEITSAFMGLAAYSQPVLTELREFWGTNESVLDEYDVLRVSAAFALLGDFDAAENIFDVYVLPKLEWSEKTEQGSYLRCCASDIEEKNVELTALASVTASILNKDCAEELAEYLVYAVKKLSATDKTEFYPLCELMCFLRYYTPSVGEDAQVTYYKNGEKQVVDLEKRGVTVISFVSRQEYEAADIAVTSGEVYAVASFMGSQELVKDQKSEYLRVEKTMASSASVGESVKVTLKVTAQRDGWVCIEDHIPSGFRLADSVSYVESDTVRFWKLVSGGTAEVTYTIKAVVPGTFVTEAPVAARADSGLMVTGDRGTVEVTND